MSAIFRALFALDRWLARRTPVSYAIVYDHAAAQRLAADWTTTKGEPYTVHPQADGSLRVAVAAEAAA